MAEYKCSRCKCVKCDKEFGLNNKNERNKTCKSCNIQRVEYNKNKKDFKYKLDDSWVEHPKYKGYFCNKLGQVINNNTKKLIGSLLSNGYIQLSLYVPDSKKVYCHHFVYETLKGKIPKGKIINHINEIKNDNRIENLELVTKSENSIKSTKLNELNKQGRRKTKLCYGKKIDDKDWTKFKSLSDASRKTNICPQSIQKVCDGIQNSCTSKSDNSKWIFKYSV